METPEKTCSKCGETKTVSHFHKNLRASDGYSSACGACRNKAQDIRARRLRDRRRYEKDKNKVAARLLARKHYKVKDYLCSVLDCSNIADQLHHIDYTKPLSVVPLCTRCHNLEHEV